MSKKVCLFLCVFFMTLFSFGQTTAKQKELEKKRVQLQQEIYRVNKLLFGAQKQQKNVLSNLEDLNKKIQVRTEFIKAIDNEINYLNSQVAENESKYQKLNSELELLKKDYADMIFKSYKSKSEQSKLMFLLSSDDFFQAYKRFRYMKQYASFRRKQGDSIVKKSFNLEALKRKLLSQKNNKESLANKNKKESLKIQDEKKNQEGLVKKIKSKKRRYTSQIKKNQDEERKIQKQIELVIREAIAASNTTKTTTKTTKTSSSKKHEFALTPAGKALASRFEQNRGKLPWPVSEGIVTRNYGVIPHKTLSGIKINSNGIHITTKKGASVRAVFKGTVLAIQSVNGRNAVYIQHGNYISLYNNLDKVYVTKGQEIVLKQTLGTVFSDKITGKTILKFQIWKDTKKQNPVYWLAKT